jgi:hypothetical protein
VCTFLLAVFAALMRDVMEAMLSARSLARWGLTCMSSAMAGVERVGGYVSMLWWSECLVASATTSGHGGSAA